MASKWPTQELIGIIGNLSHIAFKKTLFDFFLYIMASILYFYVFCYVSLCMCVFLYTACLFYSFFLLPVLREKASERWGGKEDLGGEGGETVIILYEKNLFPIRKTKQKN